MSPLIVGVHKNMSTDLKIDEKITVSLQPPKLWKVVLLNDDKTPMEFVIEVLTGIFKHAQDRAKDITLEIHNTGSAVAGVYTHEIAEQKGIDSTQAARQNGFPLVITIEPDA
jgi:ATP-dependent Clp protease adaptor protein ClpS